jgi:PAS domain S-box-containing protein
MPNDRGLAEGLPDRLCREAWEASSDGLILFDIQGNVRGFDHKFAHLMAGSITSDEIAAIFSCGCRPAKLLGAANPTATRWCRLALPDGRLLTARCHCVRVHDGLLVAIRLDGEPERGAHQHQWLNAILDIAEAVILVLDCEGRFVRFNRAAEALTGFCAREVIGKYFWQTVLFDEDVETVRAAFHRLTTGSEGSLRLENRWRTRDGSARILSLSSVVTRDPAGNPEYVVSTGIDITSVREAQDALASLSGEFIEAQSAARRDVSRYLHDTISQYLVVLGLSLAKLEREPDRVMAAEVKHTLGLVDRCCRDLRVISYALAPPLFDNADAAAAFDWYSRLLQEDARVDVEFKIGAIPAGTTRQVRLLLLAAVQEWAEKAIRYPGAGKTLITVESVELTNAMPEIRLEFVSGRPDNEAVKGILMSPVIRERVRTLGGRCEADWEQGGIAARISIDPEGV